MIGKIIVFRSLTYPVEFTGKCTNIIYDDVGIVKYLVVEMKVWFRKKTVKTYLSQIVAIQ